MTLELFDSMKPALIADLTASMYDVLMSLGDDVRYVDWVSMLPAIEAYESGNV